MKDYDINLSEVDLLKKRILDLKPLPKGHARVFLNQYPEYDTSKGLDHYRNVVNLKSADKDITDKMETLFKR